MTPTCVSANDTLRPLMTSMANCFSMNQLRSTILPDESSIITMSPRHLPLSDMEDVTGKTLLLWYVKLFITY